MTLLEKVGRGVAAVLYPVVGWALSVVVIGGLALLIAAVGVSAVWIGATVLVVLTAVSLVASDDFRAYFRRDV